MGRFKSREQMRADSSASRFHREEYRRSRKTALEMTAVVCARCGRDCEVPFKPTSNKPVYCRNCFKVAGPESSRESREFAPKDRYTPYSEPKAQPSELDKINRKLDKIMRALKIE